MTNFTGVRESVSLKYRNQAPVQQEDPVGQLPYDVLCRTATRANKGLSGSMMSGGSREADAGARRAHDDYIPEHNSPYFSARWSYSPTVSASVDPSIVIIFINGHPKIVARKHLPKWTHGSLWLSTD